MPDLGKAVYTLVLNSAQYEAGMARAEARATQATSKIAASTQRADASVAAMGPTAQKSATQVGAATGQMAAGYERAGAAAVHAGEEAQAGAAAQVSAAERAAAANKAAAASSAAAWQRSGAAMESSGKKMRNVGRNITRHISMPTAIVAGVGIKLALDYQEKISLLEAQAGATAEEMEFMNTKLLALSRSGDVIHSAEELADAMFNIESAGIRGAQALDTVTAASQGAMVGNSDLEETTKVLVAAQKSQIAGAENATKAMGALNAIVGAGMMRMDDLVGAMSTGILPAANAVGLGLTDVGAAIALFTSRGQPAQITATRLRTAFAMMAAPTIKARKALKELGLESTDLAMVMRTQGLPAAIQLLSDRLDKVKAKFKGAAGETKATQIVLDAFGGGKSGAAILTLIQGLDDLHAKHKQIQEDGDKIKQTIENEMNEPINKLRTSWSQLKGELIVLGNALIPTFVAIAQAVVKIVQAFNMLPGPVKAAVVGLTLLVAVLGPLLSMIGLATIGIGGMVTVLGGMSGAAATARVALMSLVGPWGLIAAAALAAGAAMIWAINQAKQAEAQADEALSHVGSGNAQLLTYYARRVEHYKKQGMPHDKARAAARADANKHAVDLGVTPHWDEQGRISMNAPPEVPTLNVPEVVIPKGIPGEDEDKKKKKAGAAGVAPSITELPTSLQLRQTRAERTKTLNDDLRLAREEEAFYRKRLARKKLSSEQRLELERALTQVLQRERDMIEQGARSMDLMPARLDKRLKAANRTKTLEDNLKVWNAELAYLKKLLKNRKLSVQQRLEIQKEIERTHKRIEALKKKEAAEEERHHKRLLELQATMDARGSFFAQFAGNIFGAGPGGLSLTVQGAGAPGGSKNLTVNQTNQYNEIPRDRHGQARHLQRAASASMDSM